jgi:hypothetical protein
VAFSRRVPYGADVLSESAPEPVRRIDWARQPPRTGKKAVAIARGVRTRFLKSEFGSKLIEALGGGTLPIPGDDLDAPPLDIGLIRDCVLNQVSVEVRRRVSALCGTFRCWSNKYHEIKDELSCGPYPRGAHAPSEEPPVDVALVRRVARDRVEVALRQKCKSTVSEEAARTVITFVLRYDSWSRVYYDEITLAKLGVPKCRPWNGRSRGPSASES